MLGQPAKPLPSGDVPSPADEKGGMRKERDRFLAFAFCQNDLLVEMDAERAIHFVAGPSQAFLGLTPTEMKGLPIDRLFAEVSLELVDRLLWAADKGERFSRADVQLCSANASKSSSFEVSGYKFGDIKGHYFLALRSKTKDLAEAEGRDEESGLLVSSRFAISAADRVKSMQEAGEDVQLTLVNMPQLDDFIDQLDDHAGKELMEKLAARMQASSVGGDTAGRMGDTGFGVIHDAMTDIEALQQQLMDITVQASSDGVGIKIDAATTDIVDQGISSEDIATGLLFTMNKFRESGDFTMDTLCNSLHSLAGEASKYVNVFNEAIDNDKFNIVFQPIADTITGEVHHYEVLSRFNLANNESPYQYITFAEETNRIHNFDIAVVKKTMNWLRTQPINATPYRLAINISGYSLAQEAYVKELREILLDNTWLEDKLMFEITESSRIDDLKAANSFITGLRDLGYQVCLDDFGAGAASFQYLSSLEIDVVKLDGPAVQNAKNMPKGRAFLSALTELCHKLKIRTIAEMIEDVDDLKFVRQCGVDYIQGYLIGKPNANIQVFKNLPDPTLFKQ